MGAEDHAADCGDEPDDRRDLEREEVIDQEAAPDPGGRPEAGADLALVREAPARLHADGHDDLDEQRACRGDRADRLPARAAGPRRLAARPHVRDHEQEHHDDRPPVDKHLRGPTYAITNRNITTTAPA